jgi:hypothetical protein
LFAGAFPFHQANEEYLPAKRLLVLLNKREQFRQKVDSAASAILMSASGEEPERLAEILREIIGLTKTVRTNVPDIKSREVVESANVQKLNIESPGALDAQGRPRG